MLILIFLDNNNLSKKKMKKKKFINHSFHFDYEYIFLVKVLSL